MNPNKQMISYATNYLDRFNELFQFNEEGNLNVSLQSIQRIETWYNDSYMMISFVTGLPTSPLHFSFETGIEHPANQKILLHIYSVAYMALLHFARVLKQTVPANVTPSIREIEFA